MKSLFLSVLLLAFPPTISDEFKSYWYAGTAEISSFSLSQARYGEIHEGEAVMIFVTEDFSKSKQVKLDQPQKAKRDAVSVLKLNATRKFNTGLYPYSMMLSVFSPVDEVNVKHPLKMTCSSQEWCGHTFSQINQNKDGYAFKQYSYFESEGDIDKEILKTWSEDALFNQIRLNPNNLPIGNFEMLPGLMFSRLKHVEMKPYKTMAILYKSKNKAMQMVYELKMPELERKLIIYYQANFPYIIDGWEETYTSGWGENKRRLKTSARRKTTLNVDYWNKNSNLDAALRKQLLLD